MDDLLGEFLTETNESLDVVDVELVEFERDPNNAGILDNIFRLVHTIKGTCGFLGLPRLESLAHAAETLMGKFREGAPVTPNAVSVILLSIDRIKEILSELEAQGSEPQGEDDDLIGQLDALSAGEMTAGDADEGDMVAAASDAGAEDGDADPQLQVLERELKPGEVSLDELERAFLEAPGPDDGEGAAMPAEVSGGAEAAATEPAATEPAAGEDDPLAPTAAEPELARSSERKDAAVKTQSIRVNVDTLEHLMTMVSELVLTRNQLLEMVRRLDDSEFKVPLQRLSNVTAELQEGVMKTRMQPIGNAWQKLPRIVRDLANDLEKKIELDMKGAETELDRQVLELIKDPLTHMVRNSADHGIEMPDDRIAKGKSETGRITLRAFHEGGHIIIEIADDGKGLSVDRIKSKVVERGLATRANVDAMSTAQIYKFIFAPGFSTAQTVTNVSGRGVGMDVVRTNIELIGGSIDVKSEEGRGSTFTIKIPLTLAIVSALIVQSSGHRFAVPQLNVVELVRANNDSDHRIEMINQTPVLRLRNRLLPLVRLTGVLGLDTASGGAASDSDARATTEGFIVVTQVGNQEFGIVVDSVFDTEEIVVKPMSTMLRDINVFSGNTILGDGSVIMIVDPNGIAQQVRHEVAAAQSDNGESANADVTTSANTMSLLIFSAGTPEPKAVPLSLITRLEQVDVDAIEHSNGRELVQYRGQLMPLVRMCPPAERSADGRQPILVFSDGERTMGIAVDQIIDIVDDHLDIEVTAEEPGKIGSAVIKGRATEIIDVGHYISLVFDDWLETSKARDGAGGRDLLLVDDSPFFRDMLIPVLKSAGYEVTAVASAVEAIALKNAGRRFDVIVSDIEMPEVDGYSFAEQLKSDNAWGEIPIIALSCHAGRDDLTRGRKAGFYDFVGKFDREGLVQTVGGSLRDLEDAA